MPRPLSLLPTYRHHKPTGQAVCTVRLADGRRKDLYLGRHGSLASRAEFDRILALVAANSGTYPDADPELSLNEALVRFGKFIEGYYLDAAGNPTTTVRDLKVTMGYLKRLFGATPLSEFGPPQLKAVRGAMIDGGRVRAQINKRMSHVRQFFRWCVEEQLVAPAVLEALRAIRPLAPGRSGAPEGRPAEPADPIAVDRALAFMPPAIRSIIALLRLTGARPGEILSLQPCDLDRSRETWAFTPPRHKTAWRSKRRVIYLGPQARAVLAPWLLGCGAEEFVFSPRRSEERRNRERSRNRRTKLWPSHAARNDRKRVGARRRRPPADRYNARALAHAVRRACRRAGVRPFNPYSLRHLKAVELRERYGLEVVRAVLGHSFKSMSDHYSRAADSILASRAAAEAG